MSRHQDIISHLEKIDKFIDEDMDHALYAKSIEGYKQVIELCSRISDKCSHLVDLNDSTVILDEDTELEVPPRRRCGKANGNNVTVSDFNQLVDAVTRLTRKVDSMDRMFDAAMESREQDRKFQKYLDDCESRGMIESEIALDMVDKYIDESKKLDDDDVLVSTDVEVPDEWLRGNESKEELDDLKYIYKATTQPTTKVNSSEFMSVFDSMDKSMFIGKDSNYTNVIQDWYNARFVINPLPSKCKKKFKDEQIPSWLCCLLLHMRCEYDYDNEDQIYDRIRDWSQYLTENEGNCSYGCPQFMTVGYVCDYKLSEDDIRYCVNTWSKLCTLFNIQAEHMNIRIRLDDKLMSTIIRSILDGSAKRKRPKFFIDYYSKNFKNNILKSDKHFGITRHIRYGYYNSYSDS